MRSTPQQRAWYWYDWANSAFVTTTATVIIGPYLTAIATRSACPDLPTAQACTTPLDVLGIPILPGALVPFLATFSTALSALLAIMVGVLADRSPEPRRWLAGFAWVGAIGASLMFYLGGTNWQLGVWLFLLTNLCVVASFVVYDGILIRIAGPDERDRVSSKGWAWGYVGGGILLAANLGLMNAYASLGITYEMAIRFSLLSAGLWWGLFTVIPFVGLRKLPTRPISANGSVPESFSNPFAQLASTLRHLSQYPQTVLFLVAYLFYNDGIQTVFSQSSLYAVSELQMSTSQVMTTFLLSQFVAYGGAIGFGRLAASLGAQRTVLIGVATWLGVVTVGLVLPSGIFAAFLALGAAIGLVMGGTQALSRSLYSQMIPAGRESEYFSLYQAMERGTSWLGTLVFGLIFQFSHSYRLALFALIAFFVIGGILLAKVNVRRAIEDAGNVVPRVI